MMTRIRKEQIQEPIHQMERLKHNHETIIRDLMAQFLIPNVNRQQIQRQSTFLISVEFEEKRFA